MRIYLKSWRVILILSLYLHIFVFVPVLVQGLIDLFNPIIFIDYIYALFFIALGLFANIIFFSELRILHRKPLPERLLRKWKNNLTKVVIVSVIFITIYIFRYEFNSLLLFAGYEIGRFFIRIATNLYENISGFDLDNIYFYRVAWIFQWHFIYAFIGLAEAIGRKTLKMIGK